MLKFLRRYSHYILAVFGSLLLVVFLAPTAIQEFAERQAQGSVVWAKIGPEGREIGAAAREEASAELAVLEPILIGVPLLGTITDPEHWYLLVHEADQAGLVPPLGSIDMDPVNAAQLWARIGRNSRTEQAVARLQGVARLIDRWTRGMPVSDRRLQDLARSFFHETSARVVALESKADGMPEPTEAAITAHYDTYRDIEPGAGEGPGAFGYRLPNRLTVELLHVPVEAIDASLEASGDLDGKSLAKHWRKFADERGFPPFVLGDEVPASVRDDLRSELLGARQDSIEKWIVGRQLETTRRLPTDQTGYYVLPADWETRRLALASLVDALPQAFPGLDGVGYLREDGDFLTVDELSDERFFPTATTDRYGTPRSLTSLAGETSEFGGDGRVPVQAGVMGPVLRTPEGGIVAFRILRADAARAPRELAEVRDEIVTDLKRLAAWEQLLSERESIERAARDGSLLAIAVDRDAAVQNVQSIAQANPTIFQITGGNPQFVNATPLPVVGVDKELVGRITGYAMSLPANTAPSTLPADQRIRSFPSERALTLLVLEFTDQRPLDRELFERLVILPNLVPLISDEELGEQMGDASEAFSYEALAARHAFKLTRPRDVDTIPVLPTETPAEVAAAD